MNSRRSQMSLVCQSVCRTAPGVPRVAKLDNPSDQVPASKSGAVQLSAGFCVVKRQLAGAVCAVGMTVVSFGISGNAAQLPALVLSALARSEERRVGQDGRS